MDLNAMNPKIAEAFIKYQEKFFLVDGDDVVAIPYTHSQLLAKFREFCKECKDERICKEKDCKNCEAIIRFVQVYNDIREEQQKDDSSDKLFLVKNSNKIVTPKVNFNPIQYTRNDLDFMVKAKANCDFRQNEGNCEPGPECLNCKYSAGVQAMEDFDPLAKARLQDAADQMISYHENEMKIKERNEKEEKRIWTLIWIDIACILLAIIVPIIGGGAVGSMIGCAVFVGLAVIVTLVASALT